MKKTAKEIEEESNRKIEELKAKRKKKATDKFITPEIEVKRVDNLNTPVIDKYDNDVLITDKVERIKNIVDWSKRESTIGGIKELALLFTIPGFSNGLIDGLNDPELYGVYDGFPDMFLPVGRGMSHGAFIYVDMVDARHPLDLYKKYACTLFSNAGYTYIYHRHQDGIKDSILRYINIGVYGLPTAASREFTKKESRLAINDREESKQAAREFYQRKHKRTKKEYLNPDQGVLLDPYGYSVNPYEIEDKEA